MARKKFKTSEKRRESVNRYRQAHQRKYTLTLHVGYDGDIITCIQNLIAGGMTTNGAIKHMLAEYVSTHR